MELVIDSVLKLASFYLTLQACCFLVLQVWGRARARSNMNMLLAQWELSINIQCDDTFATSISNQLFMARKILMELMKNMIYKVPTCVLLVEWLLCLLTSELSPHNLVNYLICTYILHWISLSKYDLMEVFSYSEINELDDARIILPALFFLYMQKHGKQKRIYKHRIWPHN